MSGQQNVAGATEVLPLSETSRNQLDKYQATVLDLEAKKVAANIHVPTLPQEVRSNLRQWGQPVRLFGENLADVRQRLRMLLATHQVAVVRPNEHLPNEKRRQETAMDDDDDDEQVTKYTRASHELVVARQAMTTFSLERARERLAREREWRRQAHIRKRKGVGGGLHQQPQQQQEQQLDTMDEQWTKVSKHLQRLTLEGSQYADSRSLSSCRVLRENMVATVSWSGTIQLWGGNTPALTMLGSRTLCHEDRIMGLDGVGLDADDDGSTSLLATASIDSTAKLWKVQKSDVIMSDDNARKEPPVYSIAEAGHLRGHAARLCRTAFHPMKKHVATTSFDYTWRLWDVETGQNLLLQDGHLKECFGIGFHCDGSLCATTDFVGVVHLWDLRTGKSIHHFMGHVKRVLNAEFHPNGFQLATAGDDGSIKIWDLRRRKLAASVPAHSNLITKLQFNPVGEYMVSSSFDGTAKVWSCRDWKMLNQLPGHEGKVTGVGILSNNNIVTTGWDKTLKLWG